jgi:transcription elongation GreA/GreB family factor
MAFWFLSSTFVIVQCLPISESLLIHAHDDWAEFEAKEWEKGISVYSVWPQN